LVKKINKHKAIHICKVPNLVTKVNFWWY